MGWFEAIILGLVQGLTEFLPISSSAHIRIVGEWIGVDDPGATFTAIIQIGTEAAVLVYFWKDITRIISRWFASLTKKVPRDDPDARMGWLIIIGSVPIVLLGYFLQSLIRDQFRSLWIVAISLIVFGVILGLADIFGRNAKNLENLSWRDGIVYGFAQALALIPGVSRSGGTITAGRIMGYDRPSAARYSFLLAIPAVFGSGLYELASALTDDASTMTVGWIPTIIATIIAFGSGLAVIAYLMRYIEKGSFMPFVLYRIALGTLIIVLLALGVMQPLGGAA
ncbi:undecaprenyl-diphosphate phosphatase [Pseudoclavibacter chungangensis]|uniref:Undecaprenyl-diphosphatase n=1 Tax=Pseudoclavibacter chungangensis TaxID=587635 RepID=A0A7J5BZV4_9MICO|nr:undecaprenyl-diphosphate phosphatase [Pseudoclavibacter chungangensis]KAB1660187.1 undecaprenyl-diphosphate phosphatase [Pseudoclavibacter chungangensis]NYJ66698.1 undecaprenyl-diphosphatase [Pseudoclavibacter chungangensis]